MKFRIYYKKYAQDNQWINLKKIIIEGEMMKKRLFIILIIVLFNYTIGSSQEKTNHIVKEGETLYQISKQYNVSIEKIKELNGLTSSTIFPEDMLKIRESKQNIHIVEKGESLWEISKQYGINIQTVKNINGLKNNIIYEGQHLKLGEEKEKQLPFSEYIVASGDTLSGIARIHKMTLKNLMQLNKLKSTTIYKGQRLKVRSLTSSFDLKKYENLFSGKIKIDKKPIIYGGDYYYYRAPKATQQKHKNYYEDPAYRLETLYKQAEILKKNLDKKISKYRKISNKLSGVKILLDPGHGGIDPGAIARGKDKTGTFYITEDEYVYDIALRMYILLKLHGAEVELTVLSPNHLIREGSNTFVNEKNEVYNRKYLRYKRTKLPNGNGASLSKRIEIAKNFFGQSRNKKIFISLHADNFIYLPETTSILYYGNGKITDKKSKLAAEKLLPFLGAGSYTKPRRLRVLSGNPADIKFMIETKNLAYKSQIWEMKSGKLRQREAEKIVLGILENLGI